MSPSFSCYRTNNHLAESKIAYSGCSVNTQGKFYVPFNMTVMFQYDKYYDKHKFVFMTINHHIAGMEPSTGVFTVAEAGVYQVSKYFCNIY